MKGRTMKHLKILSCVLALAATISMVATGSASATILTSPSGTEYTSGFKMTASESLLIKAGFANFTCTESTTGGYVTSNPGTGPAVINTGLSFGNCGSGTVDVISFPSLYVYTGGKVEAHFMEFTVAVFGTSCVYGTPVGTTIGTMTGGNPAVVSVSASLLKVSGGFACASPASWSGKYTVTEPRPLLVD
jgi:hypothetical protein